VWALVGIAIDSVFVDVVSWVLVILLPVAYAVAILRYRLYGIDIVISKALTYGVLAVFVTGVYVIVVVGIGSVLGGGDEPNLALSISAVAIVAVAFEPLRQRVQHWANALVYGQRAAPYDVLASVTVRIVDTRDPDEAFAQITQLVADGTGASEVALWLNVGVSLLPQAATPPKSLANLEPVRKGNGSPSDVPGDRSVAIRHRGDVMGVLSITKARGESVTAADETLLADVAASTGVLLRNIGLNAELIDRAGQLRLSRRRLVAAQDVERHRLERDLHDGAQQHVVALKVKLGIARILAEREGAEAVAELVTDLSATTQRAVDGLRAVAHGIYPPLLEAEGLEAALRPTKRTAPISVEIVVNRLGRYERSVEESVYFAVLETVSRAIDAGATRAVISLEEKEERVGFLVQVDAEVDDLTAVEDRIDAIGGTLIITSAPGKGTIVTGTVPL
jgi:signal transduction histidine kinase